MAIVVTNGFEVCEDPAFTLGETNDKWGRSIFASCSLGYSTKNAHHGKYSMKSTIGAGVSGSAARAVDCYPGFMEVPNALPIFSGPYHMRAYVSFENLSATNTAATTIFNMYDNDSPGSACYWQVINVVGVQTWRIRYRHLGGLVGLNAVGTAAVQENRIYCVEGAIFQDDAGGTGWVKMWVDGKLIITQTAIDSERGCQSAWFGQFATTAHASLDTSTYTDCVVVSDTYIGLEQPLWSSRHRSPRATQGKSGRVGMLYLK